jgi:predicted PurR-regulated permease PerM
MTLNINVETKNLIKIFTIAVLFTLGVFGLIQMYNAMVLILTAFFFALALNPAVSFLSKYMPWKKRGPAVALVIIFALALLSVLTFSIITPVAREASAFANSVPQRIEEIQNGQSPIGEFIDRYNLEDDITSLVESSQSRLQSVASTAVNKVGQFGNSIVTSVSGLVITILMLLNGPSLLKSASDKIYRDKKLRARHELLVSKMYGIVTGYVNGQVLVAVVASLAALGIIFVLKVPYPLPLASIVFVFGLIPLIGNTLAAIIVVLFTLVLKDSTSALLLAGFFVLYQQIENATLQPMVQGKTTQLPTLVIFVSVILGVATMGPIGGLFAIPIAGCAKILLVDYLDHRDDHQSASKNFAGKITDQLKKAVS